MTLCYTAPEKLGNARPPKKAGCIQLCFHSFYAVGMKKAIPISFREIAENLFFLSTYIWQEDERSSTLHRGKPPSHPGGES